MTAAKNRTREHHNLGNHFAPNFAKRVLVMILARTATIVASYFM